jgi:RNA polymerase-binding transcription factor DksA
MATAADILGTNRSAKVPARWSTHYQQLCAERDRLLSRSSCSPEISSVKLDDLVEAATEESQRCLDLVSARATQASILDVLEAIRRIELGKYGICELTGKPIEAQRLKAIPWARCSLEGQNELERSGFGRKHALPTLEASIESHVTDGDEDDADEEAGASERQSQEVITE